MCTYVMCTVCMHMWVWMFLGTEPKIWCMLDKWATPQPQSI
jgi:hypothetical protein